MKNQRSPWAWIPTLYFAEGIPYVVVMTVSVIMYKRLGISNTDIALYTSWLYLPWVIKPLWSPVVDLLKTKRWWIVIMQLLIGAGLAGVALSIPVPDFFKYTLIFFWLMAFSSATHDIAADGFYMLGLDEHKQAYFIGIRSTFYRLAMITGQGILIIVAGLIESGTGLEPVRFEVFSNNNIEIIPFEKNEETFNLLEGPRQFILNVPKLELSTEKLSTEKANEIKTWVRTTNEQNDFVEAEKAVALSAPSWWTRNISTPLKEKLKEKWGKQRENENLDATLEGNLGLLGVRLSSPPEPEEKVVLNLGRKQGDKNFKLIAGDRLQFNDNNWNKYAWLLVQLDPKMDKNSSAAFEGLSGNIPFAWTITFGILAFLFLIFFIYHRFILPHPASDIAVAEGKNIIKEFLRTFGSFFKKENLGAALGFFLLFRLGESQLVKLASPFLLDTREMGGLALTTGDVGLIYGTIGILFLTIGGILGGWLASQKGLKYWIWWMTLAINLPNLVYVYLSYATPESLWVISSFIAIEQFGYGFGFTAYMLYMIYFAEGKSKTAHFAICTGFMALGMMIPGMVSGWLQEIIGYQNFFIWVMICTVPSFIIVKFMKIDSKFGIKKSEES